MRQLIRTYEITGQHEITISDYSFTKEDVRLIINESLASTDKLASVLVSSTAKDNIVSVEEGIITLADTTAELNTDDALTIEIDIDNVAKEENATANKNELSRQIDYYGDQIERVTEDTVEAAKKDIKGADSTKVFDCITCIPALDWQDYSQLVLNDGDYAIGDWVADMESPDEIKVGTVLRANNPDVTMPIILIKSTTTQSQISVSGDAEDGWSLPDDAIDEVIHIEAGKNYVCTGTQLLRKIRLWQAPLMGTLYLWEEYKGCSIHDAKEEIITAIDNIDVDTSDLAKQGDNPDVSLTSVDEKIDGFYDTFDADIALQLQGIIGDTDESESESESIEGTSQTEEQVNALRTLQLSYNELSANLQTLVNAHVINDTSMLYDGVTFSNGYTPENILLLLLNWHTTARIIDDTNLPIDKKIITIPNVANQLTNFLGNNTCNAQIERIKLSELREILSTQRCFSTFPKLTSVELPKIETYNGAYTLEGCPLVTELYWPELKVIGNRIGHNSNIEILRFPKLTTISQYFLSGCNNLIDIETGAYFTTNMNLSAWSPTNALKSDSSSLVKTGETFANNLEKLLYNIREHLAANLPDITGQSALTITFSSAVKAAILADTDTANAFADKNWTVS